MSENKWYIGQEIVCIRTHSRKVVKAGEIYKIKALKESKCKCKNLTIIDVGVLANSGFAKCTICDTRYEKTDNSWWFSETLFAPLEYNQDEIERILEITITEKS